MPPWNIWTVLATAAVGASIALVVDFFIRPRLQVRTEKFTRRAKDKVELLAIVRSMMLNAQQLVSIGELSPEVQPVFDKRHKQLRNRLSEQAFDLQEAYGAAAHQLPLPLRQLITHLIGLTIGVSASSSDADAVGRFLTPRLSLAYDALFTPRTKFVGYHRQIARVRDYVNAETRDDAAIYMDPI